VTSSWFFILHPSVSFVMVHVSALSVAIGLIIFESDCFHPAVYI